MEAVNHDQAVRESRYWVPILEMRSNTYKFNCENPDQLGAKSSITVKFNNMRS